MSESTWEALYPGRPPEDGAPTVEECEAAARAILELGYTGTTVRGDGGGQVRETCGAQATFWPDVEACEAECILPPGHDPADIHEDETLGQWSEDELPTHHPTP